MINTTMTIHHHEPFVYNVPASKTKKREIDSQKMIHICYIKDYNAYHISIY